MTTPAAPPPPLRPDETFPVARAAAMIGGTTLVLASVVYAVLLVVNQPLHARLNVLAAAICGGAGLAALLPVWLGSRASSHGAAAGFMAGILVRMALVGGVVLYLQWGARWPHARPLSFWVAGWYLAVLSVEVKLISSHVLAVAPGPPRRPAAAGPPLNRPPESSSATSPTNPPASP